eukprot:Gregarina_sp_Poly_1__3057@NODE_185_length_11768_cov_116_496282_g160_i1_p1_GENE_NODE_185_length_11768_cov_116_496282_g160_i1NODE_185_length_11768_cov_116_496282_g160_i1_p1_ORF_typecomplete_len1266_score235_83LsmAD/PF06741_13/7_5e12SMATX/PF14438_6/0_27SMATX/PF14438_6/5_1e03_NODE_185_length_11768_cov_116_496282_g160_i142948091
MPAKQKGSSQKKRSQRQHSIEQAPPRSTNFANTDAQSHQADSRRLIVATLGDDPVSAGTLPVSAPPVGAPPISASPPVNTAVSQPLAHTESFSSARSGLHSDLSQQERVMQSRREFVFACLVGHRISLVLRDGAEINGVFALHGNQPMLPQSWANEAKPPNTCSPLPDHAYAYVSTTPAKSPSYEDSEELGGGWFVAGRKKKAVKKSHKEDSGKEDDAASSSSSSLVNSGGTFELYHSEARTAVVKQPCIWLRCAYRVAGPTVKSSEVYDWVAVPWADIICVEADNIPDNPDDYKSRSLPMAFHTDAEISRGGQVVVRQLEKWDGGGDDSHLALDEGSALSWPAQDKPHRRSSGVWDQFECNAKKFGVQSTYVEGMYSTDLDVTAIPEDYQKHAEKIADEVENSNGRRVGRAGGRIIFRSDDEEDVDDEEARFSAVAGTGRYANKSYAGQRGGSVGNQDSNKLTVGCQSRRPAGRGRGRGPLVDVTRQLQADISKLPLRTLQQANRDSTGLKRQSSSYFSSEHKSRPTQSQDDPACEGQGYMNPGFPSTKAKTAHQEETASPQQAIINKAPEESQEGPDHSQRNLKDNLNALNLEPTKTKKPPTLVKAVVDTVASRQKTRTEESKKDRKQMIEQLLASSRKIDDCLARKGWIVKEPAPPVAKPDPTPEGGGLLLETGSVGSASTGLPRPATAATVEANFSTSFPKGVEPSVVGTTLAPSKGSSGDVTPMVPTLPLPDSEDNNLKRGFQFNPNANSFTPKGNAVSSPTVKPVEYDRKQSAASSTQPQLVATSSSSANSGHEVVHGASQSKEAFLPFHAPSADFRRKIRITNPADTYHHSSLTGDGVSLKASPDGVDSGGSDDGNFFDAFVRASQVASDLHPASQVSPEWESRFAVSYLDLLNPPQCATQLINHTMTPAPAAVIMPAVTPMPAIVQAPQLVQQGDGAQATTALPPQAGFTPQPQPFPQMTPTAMFGFPAMRSVFPQAAFNPAGLDPHQPPAMQFFMNPAARVGDPSASQIYNPAAFSPQEYLNVAAAGYAPAINQLQPPNRQQSIIEPQPKEEPKREDPGNAPSPCSDKLPDMNKTDNSGGPLPQTIPDEVNLMQQGLHTLAGPNQVPILFAQQQSLLPPTAAFPPQVYLMYQQQAFLQQQAFQQLGKHPGLIPQQPVALVNPMQFLHQPAVLARPAGAGDPGSVATGSRLRNTPSQASLGGMPIDQHGPPTTAEGNAPPMSYTQDGMYAGYGGQVHGVFPPQAGVFPNVGRLYWQQ